MVLNHLPETFLCMIAGIPLCYADSSESSMTFECQQAKLKVEVQASIYTYSVTNLSHAAIVSFEILCHSSYSFQGPNQWKKSYSDSIYRAWTQEVQAGIQPQETKTFSLRVGSKGAVLGHVPLSLSYINGECVQIRDIWSPQPEPARYRIYLGILLFLVLSFHFLWVQRKRSRGQAL